jgi:cytochrome c nitrite reductase small subunit
MASPLRRVGTFMREAYRRLAPPQQWVLPVLLLAGIAVGLLAMVFRVSRASSYLSDNPATCVNCHVMAPQYATWYQSRHRETATCNDCHVPHDNPIRHYAFKASDGMRHAFMFTFRLEPQVIRIHAAGQRVVQENCVRCHDASVHTTTLPLARGDDARGEHVTRCWACHRETPHGSVRGLASVPYEHIPLPGRVTPPWLRTLMQRTTVQPAETER